MHSVADPYAMRLLHRAAYAGYPIRQHTLVPRDRVYVVNGVVNCNPSTYWLIKFGRPPLWTRHMEGVREAERDRRRHG